jgi:hypothetical protein
MSTISVISFPYDRTASAGQMFAGQKFMDHDPDYKAAGDTSIAA